MPGQNTSYLLTISYNIRREHRGRSGRPRTWRVPLDPVKHKSDELDYGIGVDYRLFEDGLLTNQTPQTIFILRPDTLYERKAETIL